MDLPLFASQRIRVLSSDPETIRLPSGLNTTELTQPVCPLMGLPMGLPLFAFQRIRVLSPDPETIRLPSGLNATEVTEFS